MSIKQINFIIACVFFVCYAYQFIYSDKLAGETHRT